MYCLRQESVQFKKASFRQHHPSGKEAVSLEVLKKRLRKMRGSLIITALLEPLQEYAFMTDKEN